MSTLSVTRWRLFHKDIVGSKFDIYVFITITWSIPLMVDFKSPMVSSSQLSVYRHWHGLCDVRCDFRIKAMMFLGGFISYLRYWSAHSGVQHIMYCVFCFVRLRLVSFVSNVVLWIFHSLLPPRFSLLFIIFK
jgi:hypothetical protein